MWHIGIDLHRQSLTFAAVNDKGEVRPPVRLGCASTEEILQAFSALSPFRAVIEATSTYRWLYDLLSEHGTVVLAHPQRMRALTLRRSKTDRLDSQLLAHMLRLNQIPLAYIPAPRYQRLRELTRFRGRLTQGQTPGQKRPAPVACPTQPGGALQVPIRSSGPVLV